MTDQLWNTQKVLDALHISRSTLHGLAKKKLLIPRAGFHGNRYLKKDVEDYIENLPFKPSFRGKGERVSHKV